MKNNFLFNTNAAEYIIIRPVKTRITGVKSRHEFEKFESGRTYKND